VIFDWAPGSGPWLPVGEREARLLHIEDVSGRLGLNAGEQVEFIRRAAWLYIFARAEQVPPALETEEDEDWEIWFLLGGRGSGKTRTGAETIAGWALDIPKSRWALVAPTLTDARETMLEGESGLLSILPPSALWGGSIESAYNSGRPELRLSNGARLRGFTSEKPARLRGPQFHGWWCDEPASFKDSETAPDDDDHPNTTFSNLRLATRLKAPGWKNRGIITGTPEPVGLLTGRRGQPGLLTGYDGVIVHKMSSRDNLAFLSPVFRRLIKRLQGTRIGRQEIEAELLTDIKGALLRPSWIHVEKPPPLDRFLRVGIGVDPAGSHRSSSSDETGIIVGGLDDVGRGWVLDDLSGKLSPAQWRDRVAAAYDEYRADAVIVEKNFGGDLVEENLAKQDRPMRTIFVTASRGKAIRAEPIAGLYEVRIDTDGKPVEPAGERIRHAARFYELEEQWTGWVPPKPGKRSKISPDRLDAQVHLFHWLTDSTQEVWEGGDLLDGLGSYS